MQNSLKYMVYSSILKSITQGEYKPGDVFSEKQLCDKYQVSKSPVREALVELCNEGVLRSIPRYGYEIIPLTDNDVKDIHEFRQILECSCLDRCFNTITNDDLAKLTAIADEETSTQSERDVSEFWFNNIQYHLTLASFGKNQYIYKQLHQALNTSMRAYVQFNWDKWHKTVINSRSVRHYDIINYIKYGDKEAAIHCLWQDIGTFK